MGRGSKSKRKRSARRRAIENIEAGESNSSSQNKERLLSSQNHNIVDEIRRFDEIRRLSTNYNTTNRSWTIGKLPSDLREINEDSFAPNIISIGPFHFDNPQYSTMKSYKSFCLVRLLELICLSKRTELQTSDGGGERPEKVYQKLVVEMKSLESDTRECYSERFDSLGSDAFVDMMILDGCFVVELLRVFQLSKYGRVEDWNFDIPFPKIRSDLLKLENQLPFFVLERLFEATNVTIQTPDLIYLTLSFFEPLLRQLNFDEDLNLMSRLINQNHENQDHLLSIIYSIFLIPQLNNNNNSNSKAAIITIENPDEVQPLNHSATELRKSGIKFKKKMDHPNQLLNIDFNKGALKIPTLTVNENAVSLYLNFMAYEKCNRKASPFFVSYFFFFVGLINAQSDVDILVTSGIINNDFGNNKDLANFFKHFSRGRTAYKFDVWPRLYYKQVNDLNSHMKRFNGSQYRQWSRSFCDKYFSNPWSFFSLLGALALLSLTATQTFYAVYGYYHPPR